MNNHCIEWTGSNNLAQCGIKSIPRGDRTLDWEGFAAYPVSMPTTMAATICLPEFGEMRAVRVQRKENGDTNLSNGTEQGSQSPSIGAARSPWDSAPTPQFRAKSDMLDGHFSRKLFAAAILHFDRCDHFFHKLIHLRRSSPNEQQRIDQGVDVYIFERVFQFQLLQ